MTAAAPVSPPLHPRLLAAAERICAACAERLPDLSGVVVLLDRLRPATALFEALGRVAAERGHGALLAPRVQTLAQYVDERVPPDETVPDARERVLILVEALAAYPHLYGEGDAWTLAEDLLALFDALSAQRVTLPDSPEALAEKLAEWYRLDAQHPALMREARLVQTLWRAWHEQLAAHGRTDRLPAYFERLACALAAPPPECWFALGFETALPAEREWLERAATRHNLHWLRADRAPGGLVDGAAQSPRGRLLDMVWDPGPAPLVERAAAARRTWARSPLEGAVTVLGTNSLEQEAEAAVLFLRAALAEGAERPAVVCEDRLLARRLRAVLESNGLVLDDAVGWALSTTAAAALLDNLLLCVEEDFPHRAFLDVLKSPFHPEAGDEAFRGCVYRFEHDIVLQENIGSGMARYRAALDSRAARLPWSATEPERVGALLDAFEQATAELRGMLEARHPARTWLEALSRLLGALGLEETLARDSAGALLLDELDGLRRAAEGDGYVLDWDGLRTWLGRALETRYFRPPLPEGRRVQLLTLDQSRDLCFDALVIAGADATQLPGPPPRLPFFNESVRAALGLPDDGLRRALRGRAFRELIEHGRRVLITWQQVEDEPRLPSPWVTLLVDFHRAAWQRDLTDGRIASWLQAEAAAAADPTHPLPPPAARPAPSLPADRVPRKWSVTAHQNLVRCPYRFFAFDVLKLKALEPVRERLRKSDYGERVHRCLQAFHFGVRGLPGPFDKPLDAAHRAEAYQLLERIAKQVFAADGARDFQQRGWLQRWLSFIDHYLDWQIARQAHWTPTQGETRRERDLVDDLRLYGRIDRVDERGGRRALIDYKTGRRPDAREVESGEDVQLASYALLLEDDASLEQMLYLGLDGREGVRATLIEGERLVELRDRVRDRLLDLHGRIARGEPLPANGAAATCRHCDAIGLCRRPAWSVI